MLRKGFTLIELLIVITIIAILAGAAIPYVQDYIEEGRRARAKADLSEIRNALVRWELDRGIYTASSIEPLVGPFLSQLLIDPWGAPYFVDVQRSHVRSFGLNGADESGIGDDLAFDFRPPMAVTKVEYTDADGSASYTTNDYFTFYFTRPTADTGTGEAAVTLGSVLLNNAIFNGPFKSDLASACDGTERKAYYLLTGIPTLLNNDIVVTRTAVTQGVRDAIPALATTLLSWTKSAN
jgi:prepilin-type N-terminal cleavage/methylation domain-containing protein